ncbi:thioredoxin-disulfide reductase [Patescibacteria group bacterium]
MENIYDVVILGGGPSGLTAAIYASRAHLKTLVLAGDPPGGQLMWTTEVENFPGFPEGIMGPELVMNIRNQALRFNAEIIDKNARKVSGSLESTFTIETTTQESFKAKTVIVATGASAKWLNLDSEQRLRGKGVSACAVCDGLFFKEKVVAIVGAGDAAMEEANFLTKYASKVYVLVRKGKNDMAASKIMQQRVFDNSKIEFIFNTEVKDVLGENSVTGVKLLNNKSNEESELEIQGLFLAIGHKPNTDFLKDYLELDHKNYIAVNNQTESSVKGVFVSGDVYDYRYRQAITASGFGCMAALDAEKLLAGMNGNPIENTE